MHTPLDVGVAFAIALALVLALWPCFRDEERFRRTILPVLGGVLALTVCYAVWVNVTVFPADVDADNLAHGVKNGWSLLGATLALAVSYWYDERKLRFETRAPLPAQFIKVILGLALLLGLRVGLKAALTALSGGAAWESGVRYFLMVLFAGCVWPRTFPYFAKLGAKEQKERETTKSAP